MLLSHAYGLRRPFLLVLTLLLAVSLFILNIVSDKPIAERVPHVAFLERTRWQDTPKPGTMVHWEQEQPSTSPAKEDGTTQQDATRRKQVGVECNWKECVIDPRSRISEKFRQILQWDPPTYIVDRYPSYDGYQTLDYDPNRWEGFEMYAT